MFFRAVQWRAAKISAFQHPIEAHGLGLSEPVHPARRADYDYLLPTVLGEELTLATWLCASDGKLTMERRFQLIRAHDQVTVLRGHWDLVCIEVSSARVRRMPAEFCAVYLAALVA